MSPWYLIPIVSILGMAFIAPLEILLALGIVVGGACAGIWLTEKMRRRG